MVVASYSSAIDQQGRGPKFRHLRDYATHLFDNSELRGSFRVRFSRASRFYCVLAFPKPSVVDAELTRLAH